jgi:hypothetical protein
VTRPATISDRLEQRAAGADAATAKELTTAAMKIASYSRAPGKRKDADRVAAVLTPAVVEALGEAFVAMRTEEIDAPDSVFGAEFQQADHAFAGLLIASADPALEASAYRALREVETLVERMDTKQAEHVQYLAGLYPEAAAAAPLRAAATERLGQEPETVQEEWARELGLEMPTGFWSFYVTVPGELADGHADVGVSIQVENMPGQAGEWRVRIGAMSANALGGNRNPSYPDSEHGTYERRGSARTPDVAGSVAPAEHPRDIARVLADLERAHADRGLTYDRSAIKGTGSPGRVLTPTRKKKMAAWLQAAVD